MNTIERNNGEYICLQCSRHNKSLGNLNSNTKYNFDRDFFKEIDSEEKAYIAGWIGSDGTICKDSWKIIISIHKRDRECLENIKNIICEELPITEYKKDMVSLDINSKNMCQDLCKLFNIERGKKSDLINFPELNNDDLTWAFIRGYFDGDGSIRDILQRASPECSITSMSNNMLKSIAEFVKIPYKLINDKLCYYGTNCIDFLGKLYINSKQNLRLKRKYEQFIDWCDWKPVLKGKDVWKKFPHCFVYKTDKNAVIPSKTKESDVGYDLSIIKIENKWHNNITLYDTGLKLSIENGFYAEVVPRSSLSKTGYMMANSIGVIDRSYRGNIYIALIKVDPSAPDIELPFRCCQIILRKQIHMEIIEVVENLDETTRGEGGFGSSGTK
jgi:dUTP pyrophosphatase